MAVLQVWEQVDSEGIASTFKKLGWSMPFRVLGNSFCQSRGRVQQSCSKMVPAMNPATKEVESEPAHTKENLQCSTSEPKGDCSS